MPVSLQNDFICIVYIFYLNSRFYIKHFSAIVVVFIHRFAHQSTVHRCLTIAFSTTTIYDREIHHLRVNFTDTHIPLKRSFATFPQPLQD